MGGVLKNMAAKLAAQKERLGILGIGLLGNQAMVYGFNWVLYPFVIWKLGLVTGFAVMIVLSFGICYGTILFYDWSKRDWLGIEAIKAVKEYGGGSKMGRIASWVMKRSEPVILVFLSIKFDPFIATVYMRHGSNKFNGMTKRDWRIFMTSLVIGNVYWAIAMFTGISVIEHLISLLK